MLRRPGFPPAVHRALRSSGLLVAARNRRRRPLPEALRGRLLAIPRLAPPPRVAVVPRSNRGDPGSTWLLASPITPLAASFVLAVAVSLFVGNPYQVGAATVLEVKSDVSPAASRLRDGAKGVAAVAAGLGEAVVDSLPRAGRSASRAIARTFQQHREPGG